MRPVQLTFHLHHVDCPHCSVKIEFNSRLEVLTDVRRACPKCEKEFLIVEGVGQIAPDKKRPRKAEYEKASAKRQRH